MLRGRAHLVAIAVVAAVSATASSTARAEITLYGIAGTDPASGAREGGAATRWRSSEVSVLEAPAVLPDGAAMLADGFGSVVRVGTHGRWSRVAGDADAETLGDGGPALRARLDWPVGVALLPGGGFLVSESEADRVRRVGPDGQISTVATGLSGPTGLAALPDGGFLVAEYARVLRISSDGTLSVVAGTGRRGFSGDGGPATAARIASDSIAVATDGSVLIGGGRRVRRVGADGTIVTVAGSGRRRTSGDGGPAVQAGIASVNGVASLPDGGFLIADGRDDRVRTVSSAGVIETFLGPKAFSDFAGREQYDMREFADAPNRISVASDGVFITTLDSVLFAPTATLIRAGVRITGARSSRARAALVVHAAQPGTLTVQARALGRRTVRRIVRRTVSIHAGRQAVRVSRIPAGGVYRTRVTLRAGTSVATDAVTMLLGGQLPRRVVAGTLDAWLIDYAGREFDGFRSGSCRRFSRRRVDCAFVAFSGDRTVCQTVVAARLASDGVVRARNYRCPRGGQPTHRRQPRYRGRPHVLDISRYEVANQR